MGIDPSRVRTRKIGYRPVKGTDLTLLSVQTMRIMFFEMGTDRFFFFFSWGKVGGLEKKKTSPDQFLDSYFSLRNNFVDRVRGTVVSHVLPIFKAS